MKAPRIGYQDGGKTKRPLDYSKSKEVKDKTEEQLLQEGYKKDVKDGKTFYYKEKESSTPKHTTPPTNNPVRTLKAPTMGTGTKPNPNRVPPTKTKPTDDYSQEILHLGTSTPIPKAVGVNTDIEVKGEEKRIPLGTNAYIIQYPNTKSGAGMSGATEVIFNNDPTIGKIGDQIIYDEKTGKPTFTGKSQKDFTAQGMGSTRLISNDVNKNSVDTQISNSQNPVSTIGNKLQETTAQGLNAPIIDKSNQGINTGLLDINTLPTTELKKRDTTTVVPPNFNKGGKVMKAPKGIKCYANGGTITPEEQTQGFYIRNGVKYNQAGQAVIGNPDMSTGYNTPAITSATNALTTSGTQFQTQGDAPTTTTTELDKTGQPKKQASANEMKARGVANTAGQALGAYGSGYFATKENTSTGDTARSGIMGAVGKTGAIGGAVAGVAAIGDQIGKPVREKSEKVDMSGELVDEGKAKKNAMIGIGLSPSKRLTYKGGLTDVTGQAYIKSIEEPYKQQVEQEKKDASQAQLNEALAARERGEVGYTAINKYKPHEFAKGGKIVGVGTGTSDSINAKIEEGSFVVPAENSHIAETLRKVVLKKAPKMKANLKQSGGQNVRLSNFEHLFSPDEVKELEAQGINLDELAPFA